MKRQEHEDDEEIRLCGGGATYHKDGFLCLPLFYSIFSTIALLSLICYKKLMTDICLTLQEALLSKVLCELEVEFTIR